ncbi:MAG TPA: alpha/beta family hydrolase [Actinomycetota bacterium]|nr:alpha/beta family hydrolase [Actinomycetota bacterium]
MAVAEQRGQLGANRSAVSGAWIVPKGAAAWIVIAHGAGAGMDHPFVVGFCRAMADEGIAAARFNFHYMSAGRRSPDPEASLRAAWNEAFDGVRAMAGDVPVLVGGKSLGGRIASMCVADGMAAAGLVFLGYPLHPPGKTDRLRADHLARIRVPMLYLQGTKDPFARPEVLERVVAKVGDRATLHRIEGGDHSFRVRGASADDREVGASLAAVAAPFVRRVVESA